MTFTLSQVMATLDSDSGDTIGAEQKNPNRKRTLKRKPEPQLNKLKNTARNDQPLSEDIYLEDDESGGAAAGGTVSAQDDEPT